MLQDVGVPQGNERWYQKHSQNNKPTNVNLFTGRRERLEENFKEKLCWCDYVSHSKNLIFFSNKIKVIKSENTNRQKKGTCGKGTEAVTETATIWAWLNGSLDGGDLKWNSGGSLLSASDTIPDYSIAVSSTCSCSFSFFFWNSFFKFNLLVIKLWFIYWIQSINLFV